LPILQKPRFTLDSGSRHYRVRNDEFECELGLGFERYLTDDR